MDHDGESGREAIPTIIEALAMQVPRVRAALERHLADDQPLGPLLREAHRLLWQDAAQLMLVAGAAPFAEPPAWPEGAPGDDTVSEPQLLALVTAADQREIARGLVTRRAGSHSASMLPRDRSH